MAEKILKTRIQLKGDSYKNWIDNDPVLLNNEIAIVPITAEDNAPVNKPGVYFKVGNGTSKFSELEFTSGIAGDVYEWAKAANKPTYTASEIEGIEDFISGQVKDTNTKYQIIQDTENKRKFTLQSKELGSDIWSNVTVVTIPETAHTLVEGTANGTVKFDGTDVPVHGLKSAAYQESSAFDAAGAAATVKTEIVGADEDASTANTIKGTKKYVDEQIAAIPEVTVPEYTIVKSNTPSSGAFATYELKKNGTLAGAKIDIPKDYLVKSANIKTATGDSDPSGFPDGTKYIDFVVNSVEGLGNESHIYLNVNDLAVSRTVKEVLDTLSLMKQINRDTLQNYEYSLEEVDTKFFDLKKEKNPDVRYYACVIDKNRAGAKPTLVFRLNLAYNVWEELGYLRLKQGKVEE